MAMRQLSAITIYVSISSPKHHRQSPAKAYSKSKAERIEVRQTNQKLYKISKKKKIIKFVQTPLKTFV